MIEYKTGDIFAENAEALVNSVNCVGVMGRGIALQFKKRFPDNFDAYAKACNRNEVVPGRMFVHETGRLTNPRYIINFPTKRHWRGKSRIGDIEAGLECLVEVIPRTKHPVYCSSPVGNGFGRAQLGRRSHMYRDCPARIGQHTCCRIYSRQRPRRRTS